MSKRAQIQKHLETLNEIGGIMGAMKNISLMETHKLARFLGHQHRVLASIEAAALDFLSHHSAFEYPIDHAATTIIAIGSQRGFCGDFNELVIDAIRHCRQKATSQMPSLLVVGRRLASRLANDVQVTATFDGPSVAEEVHPVLIRLMNALSEMQAQKRQTDMPGVTVIAHREGEDKLDMRAILPMPPLGHPSSRFAYPALLTVAPPIFFTELARHYLWAQMHDVFYSSLMAENRRRLQHMEGAIRRVGQKADEMQRRCNMLRQEEITEEIELIMLSSDALQAPRRCPPRPRADA